MKTQFAKGGVTTHFLSSSFWALISEKEEEEVSSLAISLRFISSCITAYSTCAGKRLLGSLRQSCFWCEWRINYVIFLTYSTFTLQADSRCRIRLRKFRIPHQKWLGFATGLNNKCALRYTGTVFVVIRYRYLVSLELLGYVEAGGLFDDIFQAIRSSGWQIYSTTKRGRDMNCCTALKHYSECVG